MTVEHRWRSFRCAEQGNMTVLGLFFFMAALMAGSLAIDFGNKEMAEKNLQILADITGHAAMATRLTTDANHAVETALGIAARNTGPGRAPGITEDSIQFGRWDAESRTFSVDPNARRAVRVNAYRDRAHGNMVEALLIQILGFAGFELQSESVFIAKTHPCALNGIVAENEIRFTSGNEFADGYCLRSDRDIKLSIDNRFGQGAIVSLPRRGNLQTPAGRTGRQPGLEDALSYEPKDQLDFPAIFRAFDTGLRGGDPMYLPAGVAWSWDNVTEVGGRLSVTPALLASGEVHVFLCGSTGTLAFGAGTFSDMAIWTDCRVTFSAHSALEGVTFVQDNGDRNAMHAPAGVRLGANDGCAETGNTILMTSGGVHIAADLEMNQATLAAQGQIRFAAKPNGMRGAAILSGDTVEGTSSGSFGYCAGDRFIDWQQVVMVR